MPANLTVGARVIADLSRTGASLSAPAQRRMPWLDEVWNNIGIPGTLGFGVGVYPGPLPAGFDEMVGTNYRASDNYGNYQYSDGSIMCWIPAFYYRIAHSENPTYATYGVNSIDIKPFGYFGSVAEANANGYALHRAFYDGDATTPKNGFFVDKYQISNNGGVASSIRYGAPLSSSVSHNGWGSLLTGLTTGDNILAGAIKAAKTRGSQFHCISQFQWAALALLATAHGQSASSTAFCAWYLTNKNYPKGNNNNALKDVDDTSVTFIWDGYAGNNSAQCGSGTPFDKTTHNGQNSGVADLNGNMIEVTIGMTCIAESKTIKAATKANPCQITITNHGYVDNDVVHITSVVGMTSLNDKLYTITKVDDSNFTLNGVDSSGYADFTSGSNSCTKGTFYAATPATAMKNFTSGNSTATDHWGATGVAAMMEPISPNFATTAGSNDTVQRYGNSTNQVLAEETSGANWTLTGLGLPKAAGVSASGTNLFGTDFFYQYIRNESVTRFGGYWLHASSAGVWALILNNSRTHSYSYIGARACAYV